MPVDCIYMLYRKRLQPDMTLSLQTFTELALVPLTDLKRGTTSMLPDSYVLSRVEANA